MAGNIFAAAGMFMLGIISPQYSLVVVSMLIYNVNFIFICRFQIASE